MQSITLIRPDDWHLHVRDDAALDAVVPHTAARFGRALIMPNLKPPVTTTAQALAYRERILAAARANGVQVLHTIIEALTEDCRDASLDHKLSNLLVPKGHPLAPPIDELAPIRNEIVLPKTSSGVFNSTNIDYVLRNLGIRYLIVAGVVTDQCVDMAVRDAADRGYLVSVPGDACATYTQERHDNALKAYGGYCWVTDTDTVVSRIEAIARAAA